MVASRDVGIPDRRSQGALNQYSSFGYDPDSELKKKRVQSIQLNRLSYSNQSTLSVANTVASEDLKKGVARRTVLQRLSGWMVNEGGRKFFIWTWIFVHLLVYTFAFLNFQFKDNLTKARATFSYTYPIARSAALVLHVDVAFILLPICRNFITLLRRSALNHVIPFEKNITFHKFTGWSICLFSGIHIAAHMVNFTELAIKTKTGVIGFIGANFLTGPGATGWIMTIALSTMVFYSVEKRRRARFERFWYAHHLFIVFFVAWQLHGMFCMIQPDSPPYCDFNQIGVFWKYWLVGGVIFVYERILREIRSHHHTFIYKVVQHPSKVCEIQIKKEKTKARAGQYIFFNCPEVSYWQWHPFTLTSSPEEDFISVHIRCVGDFTLELAEKLGCDWSKKVSDNGTLVVEDDPTKRILPRVMVDGPFGSASEDVFKFEAVILCGAGIGVTPFASVLKSIWYRMNNQERKKTRLRQVYFHWVCREFESFEWFQSLLLAIEEEDKADRVKIYPYMTAALPEDVVRNIVLNRAGAKRDPVTGLRHFTTFGRPDWDANFSAVRRLHPATDVGVFFCGPAALGHVLHVQCNKWTGGDDEDTRFFWGKENF